MYSTCLQIIGTFCYNTRACNMTRSSVVTYCVHVHVIRLAPSTATVHVHVIRPTVYNCTCTCNKTRF